MEEVFMELHVFLPFRIFKEIKEVRSIVTETREGSFGILPHRLDCVATVRASIFTYETKTEGVGYLAIDTGVLVKAGTEIFLSVRSAFAGADLGELQTLVEKEFLSHSAQDENVRNVAARLEGSFLASLEKLRKL